MLKVYHYYEGIERRQSQPCVVMMMIGETPSPFLHHRCWFVATSFSGRLPAGGAAARAAACGCCMMLVGIITTRYNRHARQQCSSNSSQFSCWRRCALCPPGVAACGAPPLVCLAEEDARILRRSIRREHAPTPGAGVVLRCWRVLVLSSSACFCCFYFPPPPPLLLPLLPADGRCAPRRPLRPSAPLVVVAGGSVSCSSRRTAAAAAAPAAAKVVSCRHPQPQPKERSSMLLVIAERHTILVVPPR